MDRLKRGVRTEESRHPRPHGEFIGTAEALRPLFDDLERLRDVSAPTVLILGETGTGKDVLARTIHNEGPRRDELFVEVDCTALPEALLESELFGHERGAFTDARATKRGMFEVAAGGTVFLDEIGELSPGSQAKLLRALENRTFRRVGGVTNLRLDATVIAATNRDLRAEVAAGRFREDLFYRLDVVTLTIPPLRERIEDIPILCEAFLARFRSRFGSQVEGVSGPAMERMLAYGWPGNVRELKNVLERVAIMGASDRVEPTDLQPRIRYAVEEAGRSPFDGVHAFELPAEGIDFDAVERSFVIQALARSQGNRTEAGQLLGLTRHQIRTRIVRYGLADA